MKKKFGCRGGCGWGSGRGGVGCVSRIEVILKMQEKALGWGGGQLGGGGVECEPSYLKLKTKVKVGAGEGVRWRGM